MNRNIYLFIIASIISTPSWTSEVKSLDKKIGQLFMVAAVSDELLAANTMANKPCRMDKEYIAHLIIEYHIGGIIYLGRSDDEKQIERTTYFQSISTIPLLVGQDLEPGRVGRSRLPDSCNFISNKELGELNNLDHTKEVGRLIGLLCKKLGVHINFAPVIDVNNNPDNPVINDRAFSDNKETVAQHGLAFLQGLSEEGIIGCAKHFPGHGDTNVDSHYDLPVITHDAKRLHSLELYPFKQLIAMNIPAIMTAHLEIPAFEPAKNTPSSLSKNIVTTLLEKELGFTGLKITDSLHMNAVTDYYKPGECELHALLAGNDILLCPVDVPAAIKCIKQAIADNLITEQEIDVHVEKILRIKQKIGLY